MPAKLTLALGLLFFAATGFAAPGSQKKGPGQDLTLLTPKAGTIHKGMPKEEIVLIGFTKETMLDYYTYDGLEFMVFSDPTTVSFEDIVTFIIKDGKVIDWFKGYRDEILKAGM